MLIYEDESGRYRFQYIYIVSQTHDQDLTAQLITQVEVFCPLQLHQSNGPASGGSYITFILHAGVLITQVRLTTNGLRGLAH